MWQSTYPHHHRQYHHKHRATATPRALEATGAVKAVAVVVVEVMAAEVVEAAVVAQEAAQQAVVGLGTARVATHVAVAKVLVAVHVGLAVARAAGLAMAQAVDMAAARVGLVVVATVLVVPAVRLMVVPVTLARADLVALAFLMALVLGPQLVAVVAVAPAVLAVVLAAVLAAFRVSTWKLQATLLQTEMFWAISAPRKLNLYWDMVGMVRPFKAFLIMIMMMRSLLGNSYPSGKGSCHVR